MSSSNFDRVLQVVGGFGLYQKRLILLLCISSGTVILQNLSPVFTMKIPRHRCRIPGLENDTYEIQHSYHAFLINRTIPLNNKGRYSQCSLYNTTDDIIGEKRTEVMCDDWVFDKSVFQSTYVTELQLVCHNKQYRSHSTMMIFIGKFFGAFCNSVGGDYFGRRRMYLVMMLALTATGVALEFVSSLPALMLLRFCAGAFTTGIYLPAYIITIELQGSAYRRMTGVASKMAGIAAGFLASLCAFLFRDWRHFQACLAAPNALLFLGYWFLPESPRWLCSKGRLDEAQKIVDQIAKANGVWPAPRLDSEAFSMTDKCKNTAQTAVTVSPYHLFRVPRLLLRYTLLYGSWILVIMCLYGLKLNVSNMKGNIFLNYSLMTGMDVVALLLFTLLIEKVGRRVFTMSSVMVGGVACLSTILPTVLGGNEWIIRGLSFVGTLGVSAGLSGLYTFSPELFPTVLRSFGLGSCSMMSRLGGMASPYVADLNVYISGMWGPALPQIVFGVAGITTACMLFFQPETRGRFLPETVRDAEFFGRSEPESKSAELEVVATTPKKVKVEPAGVNNSQ